MALYHKDVGFPGWYERPTYIVQLRYGTHAQQSADTDQLGKVNLPDILPNTFEPIEIEVIGSGVNKTLYRGPYDHYRDLSLVVERNGFVRTIWFNHKKDTHNKLDTSKYVNP